MTLRERQGDIEIIHQDEQELSITQWSNMLEISGSTFRTASYRAEAREMYERKNKHSIFS